MRSLGKTLRMRRLLDPSGRTVIVPMDHGASNGPMPGIEDPARTVEALRKGGATAVVAQKGIARAVAPALGELGLLVHLSVSTSLNPDPNDKVLVGSVEECVRMGADGVSVHVNVGAKSESRMVADLGAVSDACDAWGMPLLAMMYPRGHEIEDPHDLRLVRHVARLGAEVGADIVKVPYTGTVGSFREVVRSTPVPVVVSGGARMGSDPEVLQLVHDAIAAGAAGVSIGRNVWQASDPAALTRAVSEIVIRKGSVERALDVLKG